MAPTDPLPAEADDSDTLAALLEQTADKLREFAESSDLMVIDSKELPLPCGCPSGRQLVPLDNLVEAAEWEAVRQEMTLEVMNLLIETLRTVKFLLRNVVSYVGPSLN